MRRFIPRRLANLNLDQPESIQQDVLVDLALPASTTSEQTGLDLSNVEEMVLQFFGVSITSNGTDITLQFGDATDYTTGLTARGSTIDESGVSIGGWSALNGMVVSTGVAAAATMHTVLHIQRMADAIAVSNGGAGATGWSALVGGGQDNNSSERTYGGGYLITTKTVDRLRLNASSAFTAGRWGVTAVRFR